MKYKIPQLEKEIKLMFQWLKMFFFNKKHNLINLIFIYVMTLGWSLSSRGILVNVIQEKWWGAPIMSPFLDIKLGIFIWSTKEVL